MALKAIIMAGGEGFRLQPLTVEMPKPLAPLAGEPVMGYALKLLDANGTETELPFAVTEGTATFMLNFDAQDEIPVRTLHLVPVQ